MDKITYSDLQYLTVRLPEDIEKVKWYGDFKWAQKIIDLRLEKDLPTPLRKRLELEKWVLKRLPLEYVYTPEEALELFQATIEGAAMEEFENLQDEGAIDWLFIKGQVRYKNDFMENILKTRKELWPRLKDPSKVEGRIRGSVLLDKTVETMKERGGLAYRIHVRTALQVEKDAEQIGRKIRVHLPLPVEKGQVKNFRLLGTSVEPLLIAAPDSPQRTVCIETALEPEQEFWAEYVFENHTPYTMTEEVLIPEKQPDKRLEPYLGEELPHIRFTPYMKALTEEVTAGEKNPLKKARKIYDYITTHVMYSFVRQYATIDNLPEYMAVTLKGDCGIYALLFITMCRIAGVPARWQSGLYATPLEIGCHDWAQFYIKSYGWLYADCSFGGAAWRDGNEARWNFYFGNVDPFRIPTCSEFQHEFTPPRLWLREDPYDNQCGEAEYEDRGLIAGVDYQTKTELMEIEEIPYISLRK